TRTEAHGLTAGAAFRRPRGWCPRLREGRGSMTTTIEPPHETETDIGTGTGTEAGAGLSVAQRFAVITEQLAALAEVDAGGLASAEILEAIDAAEQARRRLEAVTLGLFSAAEADGMWATTGARSFPSWVAART